MSPLLALVLLAACDRGAPPPPATGAARRAIEVETLGSFPDLGAITDLAALPDGRLLIVGTRGFTTFDPVKRAAEPVVAYAAPTDGPVRAADLDGDGEPELVAAGGPAAPLTVLGRDGAVRFTHDLGAPVRECAIVDVDGDGDLELALLGEGTDLARLVDHTGALVWEQRWSADARALQRLPGRIPHLVYVDGLSLVTRDGTGEVVTRVRPDQGGIARDLLVAWDLPAFPGPTLVVPHQIAGQGDQHDLFAPDGETPRGSLPWERVQPWIGNQAFTGPRGLTHVHAETDRADRLWVRFYDEGRTSLWSHGLEPLPEGPAPGHALLTTGDAAWAGWGPALMRYTRPADAG